MDKIFQKRRHSYYAQQLKYLRYVFNDHFVLFIVIAAGALGVGYARFLQHSSLNFLEKLLVVMILSVLGLFVGHLATFLEEADSVFLLAKEDEVVRQLRQMLPQSLILPGFVSLLLIGIAAPALKFFWPIYLIWFFVLLAVKVGLYVYQLRQFLSAGSLDWFSVIHYEENRQARLLKIYALFTNVKGLVTGSKRRKYLDFLLPKKVGGSYGYLYSRTFLRTGDYLGLTLRLAFLALIGSLVIPNFTMAILFATLMNYLLIFQLLALREAYQYQPLLRIYPTDENEKRSSLQQLILKIMLIVVILEVIVLSVVSWRQALYAVIFAVVTLVLSALYVRYRLREKSKKK